MGTTLVNLRLQSRYRADMTDSQFVSDTELNTYINNSYGELYDLLVTKFEDYFVSTSTFTISSGNTQALPSDFYKLLGVDKAYNGGEYTAVRKFNFAERNRDSISGRVGTTYPVVRYRVLGANLHFTPDDHATGDYRIWYVPQKTELSGDSSEISDQIILDWDEYIIVDAAIKMLIKEESDVSALMAQKQMLIKRIEEAAQVRDEGEPERVTDVNSFFADDLGFRR